MPYQADSSTIENAGQKLHFKVEQQSLVTALREYSEVTGETVMVDDALAAGRKSPGVRGDFSKVDALQILLAGTGLTARYASDQAFTLSLVDSRDSETIGTFSAAGRIVNQNSDEVSDQYAGEIQRSIEAAVCQFEKTRSSTFRLALQIWISSSGKVEKTKLLSATQSSGKRDAEIIQLMDQLSIDPPPAQLPQPITVLFLPGRAVSAPNCPSAPHSKRG